MMCPKVYAIKNQQIEVHISDFGLIIQKIIVQNNSNVSDVVLGFDQIEDYYSPEYLKNYPYFGAVMGRCANRIGGASFNLHGKKYELARNAGKDHLHGGISGFDKKFWTAKNVQPDRISFEYLSLDGEEGYPGNLRTEVEFSIQGCSLQIHYHATCDQDCFVNITHHPYFNLYSEEATVKSHILQVFTDHILESHNLIPTGNIIPCPKETDFQLSRSLQNVIEQHGGLDHTYIYNNDQKMKKMAVLMHPKSQIHLTIYSDFPSMQVYTGAFIDVHNGKRGNEYPAFAGIAFEPQMYPDAPNHSNFPSTLLTPNTTYDKSISYNFEE